MSTWCTAHHNVLLMAMLTNVANLGGLIPINPCVLSTSRENFCVGPLLDKTKLFLLHVIIFFASLSVETASLLDEGFQNGYNYF